MKKIIFWIAVIFAAIQFVPVDRENKAVDKHNNFVDIYNTPTNIKSILKNACYDCHSNEVKYPNYAYVAPISWTIKDHINEGREHLNFSEWGTYNKELKQNAVEKTVSSVRDLQMPLPSYINYHPKANLTTKQRKELGAYFSDLQIN